jgi:predicted anti-sigma-YlaC factor YlaD
MAESGPHISCQAVVELVTDYLEAALAPDDAALLEQHLNFCEGCIWYVHQTRVTIQTVGRVGTSELTDETRTRLLTMFRDWKRS